MANLFFSGEKASKEEARKALMEHIADNWTGTFTANFHTDGGGIHIQAVLEFEDTNELMSFVQSFLLSLWAGAWWCLKFLAATLMCSSKTNSDNHLVDTRLF